MRTYITAYTTEDEWRAWLQLRVRLFIIHQTYEQKTHIMNARRADWRWAGSLKEQTGRQNVGLAMHWQAYRLPGLKFNSRSYGRNLL